MLVIRKAQVKDCSAIYNIRNNVNVLKYFFQSRPVSLSEHELWFKKALENPLILHLVITEAENVVGIVRFDFEAERISADISVYVAHNSWGKGIGKFALLEGERLLRSEFPSCFSLKAKVFVENEASLKLFESCNYKPIFTQFTKDLA